MNPLEFSVFILPRFADLAGLRELVHTAEDGGFDLIAIQDHPYVPQFLDTMSLIGVLLGETSRVRFFPDVANLPLRPPAMLAKAAASLDLLSSGRFELGLGGGGNQQGLAAIGGPQLTPRETVDAFEEAIAVIRAMWTGGGALRFEGKHYRLADVQSGPTPAHPIGIWVGARGPRMLKLTGRLADGWITPVSMPYEDKPGAQALIDEAARNAGRDPSEVRRIMQLVGTVTDVPLTTERPRQGPGYQPIRTTPAVWGKIVAELVHEERFDAFNFAPEQQTPEQIRRFATEVVPAARELAART